MKMIEITQILDYLMFQCVIISAFAFHIADNTALCSKLCDQIYSNTLVYREKGIGIIY